MNLTFQGQKWDQLDLEHLNGFGGGLHSPGALVITCTSCENCDKCSNIKERKLGVFYPLCSNIIVRTTIHTLDTVPVYLCPKAHVLGWRPLRLCKAKLSLSHPLELKHRAQS